MEKQTLAQRSSRLLRWHRRLGVVACVGVLAWSVSGMLHPLMSRMQPRALNPMPPVQTLKLEGAMALSDVLLQNGIDQIAAARVVQWPAGEHYQVTLSGTSVRRYFDLRSGAELADADRDYAQFLARHYLGDHATPIASTSVRTGFDDEYTFVNRLLPVQRVEFARDDRMRVYVDTGSSRLGTLVDERKAWMSALFRTLHTWEFAGPGYAVRLPAMLLLLAAAASTAALGLWIYWLRWRQLSRNTNLRRVHRLLGLAVAGSTLLFTVSGSYHLLKNAERAGERLDAAEVSIATGDLTLPPQRAMAAAGMDKVSEVLPVRIGNDIYWRLSAPSARPQHAGGEHQHRTGGGAKTGSPPQPVYIDARNSSPLANGEQRRARYLAARASGSSDEAVSVQPVFRFGGEYGFVFKRLPVQRVEYANGERWYVEPSSGALAARIDAGAAREGWVFAYLHKWDWLKHLAGADLRDAVVAAFALGNMLVVIFGLILFVRSPRSARRASTGAQVAVNS